MALCEALMYLYALHVLLCDCPEACSIYSSHMCMMYESARYLCPTYSGTLLRPHCVSQYSPATTSCLVNSISCLWLQPWWFAPVNQSYWFDFLPAASNTSAQLKTSYDDIPLEVAVQDIGSIVDDLNVTSANPSSNSKSQFPADSAVLASAR